MGTLIERTARRGEAAEPSPVTSPSELRIDFGAHLHAHYQRLVGQLYAITLHSGEAHDAVQDAYSRAWRSWSSVGALPDPAAWVRRVAVRSTMRSWRRCLARLGLVRDGVRGGENVDPRTRAMLGALGRLPAAERRAVVLADMARASVPEIAALERVSTEVVETRLHRARQVMLEGMADVLPAVLGLPEEGGR